MIGRVKIEICCLVVAAVVAALLAGCEPSAHDDYLESSPAPQDLGVADYAVAPCPVKVSRELEAECGELNVPEDWDRPGGKTISLPVMVLEAGSAQRAEDPILYLTGGPGSPGIDADTITIWHGLGRRAGRDVILYGQRGTGLAKPSLECPEVTELGEDADSEARNSALGECKDRLTDEKVDLSAYTTTASARDIAALKQAMRIREWNVAGTSYGTRLALILMRNHPDGIRSAVLDGVYPPNFDWFGGGARSDVEALLRTAAACASESACAQRYPDLEATIRRVATTLDTDPVDIRGEELDGQTYLDLLIELIQTRQGIAAFPRAVHQSGQGDWLGFESTVEEAERLAESDAPEAEGLAEDPEIGEESQGMFLSVECAEDQSFSVPPPESEDLLWRLRARSNTEEGAACAFWPHRKVPPGFHDAVTSPIPTLLLSGELDNLTPPEEATRAASTLERSQNLVFPRFAHAQVFDDECGRSLVVAFLDDPTATLEASCISRVPPVDFR